MIKKVLLLGISLFIFQAAFSTSIPDLIKNSGCSADYPNQNLLVIFDSTSVDMQESGLSYYHTHTLYKILSLKVPKILMCSNMAMIRFRHMWILKK